MASPAKPPPSMLTSNLSFQLPDLLALTSSFPFRVNRNCKFATDSSEGWLLSQSTGNDDGPVLSQNEREALRSVKYGLLASLCSPTSDGPQLRVLTDFLSLVFVSHGRILEGNESHGWRPWTSIVHVESAQDALELLESNVLLKHIVPSLQQISRRLPEAQRLRWNKRFLHSAKAFARAQLRLYENLKSNTIPTLPEYIKLRRETYGTSMFIDLLDLLEISSRPSGIPGLHQFTVWAIDIVAWILDIFSYASGSTGPTRCDSHNLVSLLTTHKNLSVQGAMNYAGGMVKEALEELGRLERELSPPTSGSSGTGNGVTSSEGTWGWLNLVKSAVGLSVDVSAGRRPRSDCKFLTDAVMGPPPTDDDDASFDLGMGRAAGSTADTKSSSEQTARYVQALKDYIVGSIHWGYETELYFGQKGDEVRSFGWVFLANSDHM
ncbi:hypothetical protein EST38_g12333 [Candolleomyces aberdarensis]|uniref:Uncharacterized protein n=1 Tax=Candolleomyces aberdarensis TaxID=2316362 RepID=A0A4Q2D453_9AGAR|nr:hypothetical protein EST38_g12333 [Candolleomyces aberdarensis]